jgi:hypothetical protein
MSSACVHLFLWTWTASVLAEEADPRTNGGNQIDLDTGRLLAFEASGFILGDFQGDELLDVAVGGEDALERKTISVYLGQNDGGVGAPLVSVVNDVYLNLLFTGDFNGDGALDIGATSPSDFIAL